VGRFGSEQVHVAFFEDLMSAPAELWKGIGAFLEHDLGPERFDDVRDRDRNRAGRLRWPRVDAFLRSLEGSESGAIETAKRVLPPGLHRRALQRFGRLNRTSTLPLPRVDHTATLAELDEYYAEDAAQLAQYVTAIPAEWSAESSGRA
jgi:hypothetical protein